MKELIQINLISVLYSNEVLKIEFKNFVQNKISFFGKKPVLNIIQVGDELASNKYIEIKKKVGFVLGVEVNLFKYTAGIFEDEIKQTINFSKSKREGLIFQLPLPEVFQKFVSLTPLNCDVDLLGDESGKLWKQGFLPPTIGAIDLVLKDILGLKVDINFKDFINKPVDLTGMVVAVIGQGVLVGGPLLEYLKNRGATILSLNKDTKNPKDLVKFADIVLCAAGSPLLIDKNWLKNEAIIIDAATSESENKLIGDVDKENIYDSNILSPSPGGIGAITVLYLFWNLTKLSTLQ